MVRDRRAYDKSGDIGDKYILSSRIFSFVSIVISVFLLFRKVQFHKISVFSKRYHIIHKHHLPVLVKVHDP